MICFARVELGFAEEAAGLKVSGAVNGQEQTVRSAVQAADLV